MRFKNSDLIIVMLIVALNVVWTQVSKSFLIESIIFVLPLIFFLPGYAFIQILFSRRGSEQIRASFEDSSQSKDQPSLKIGYPIGGVDKFVLSLGLSIAIDVLVGFALNFLPIGLNAFSWTVSLSLITTVCSLLAVILRHKNVPGTAITMHVHITLPDVMFFILAVLVVFSAVWFSLLRPISTQTSFTQFWMLPANQASKTCTVSLGIQSFEANSESYRVVINVNHTQTNIWSSIALNPQQKWVRSVSITPGTASDLYIEAQLYRLAKPDTVYRNVHLTFYISSINLNGLIRQQCLIGTQG